MSSRRRLKSGWAAADVALVPKGLVHVAVILGLCVAAVALALGAGGFRRKHPTARELRAERLVQLRLREDVTCHETKIVNAKFVRNASLYYLCKSSNGESYLAIVNPAGLLSSLDGPLPAK